MRSASAVYYRKQTIWRAYIHLSPCRIYIEFLIKRNYNRVLNYAWHANCGVGKRDTTRSRSPNNSDFVQIDYMQLMNFKMIHKKQSTFCKLSLHIWFLLTNSNWLWLYKINLKLNTIRFKKKPKTQYYNIFIICFRIVSVRRYIYCRVGNQFPFLRKEANTTMIVRGGGGVQSYCTFSPTFGLYTGYVISFSIWLQFFSGWIGITRKVVPIKTRSNFQGRTHLTH